jgi:hypothetical protein
VSFVRRAGQLNVQVKLRRRAAKKMKDNRGWMQMAKHKEEHEDKPIRATIKFGTASDGNAAARLFGLILRAVREQAHAVISTTKCPFCAAEPGSPCAQLPDDDSIHPERIEAWKAGVFSVSCPVCRAKAGVPCGSSIHNERIDVWTEVKLCGIEKQPGNHIENTHEQRSTITRKAGVAGRRGRGKRQG